MLSTDLLTETQREARRQIEICNACRYCEGFCAVFPALQRRSAFTSGDVNQLANLCHNCKGCYYACQYVAPHPFALNLPQVLSEARAESYAAYAWPQPLARAFERNGTVVGVVTAVCLTLGLLAVSLAHDPATLFAAREGPGSFYQVIPWQVMSGLAGGTFIFALLALAIGVLRFWRDTSGRVAHRSRGAAPLLGAAGDVLTLANLGGGGHGCNDRDASFSTARRRFHHALFYGFLLCFASTTVAWGYDQFLGLVAPYPFFSLPVVLGTAGGIGMTVGASGLLWLKAAADQAPAARRLAGADAVLLLLLLAIAVSGLLLLALRSTPAMSLLLAGHLALVLALFGAIPYSKFVHGIYRSAALLRDRRERIRETRS